ncbi:hypothetical protein E3N88_44532 [Mikania micrantha]|uniref:CCHC-type domain-containing protein n=1 Tax=Mikania micrantha TaxID=192012 RepID=A0A5N6LCD2_9ASTR|nr:hypothetical protein E3N88_44532 [Mikania micrantha]
MVNLGWRQTSGIKIQIVVSGLLPITLQCLNSGLPLPIPNDWQDWPTQFYRTSAPENASSDVIAMAIFIHSGSHQDLKFQLSSPSAFAVVSQDTWHQQTEHSVRLIKPFEKQINPLMAAGRPTLEQQVRELQAQLQELTITMQHRRGRTRTPPRYRPDDDADGYSTADDYNPYGRGQQRSYNSDIKVDIPEYDGRLDPDEFIEWLRTVERVFDYKQTPDEKKVKIVALKFRKYASTWWFNVCSKREKQGKDKVRTWSKMKKLLKCKFMPSYYVQANFSQLHALKQGSKTAEEYSREFEHLIMKCDVDPDDPQTLVRYLGGLETRIANIIELQPYSTLEELITLAHKVDIQHKLPGRVEITKTTSKLLAPTSSAPALLPATSTVSKLLEAPEGSGSTSRNTRRCFRCQGLGHIASECPNKRVITLTEFDALTDPVFDKEPGLQNTEEVVELGPDEGECLVVRRTLTGTVHTAPNQQREAIFRTRCTIKNKVCSLVIDGGSCTNVASQIMVHKLNLTSEPHPSPYDIQWLNQGKGLRITNRVLLAFTVGTGYKDEVWLPFGFQSGDFSVSLDPSFSPFEVKHLILTVVLL